VVGDGADGRHDRRHLAGFEVLQGRPEPRLLGLARRRVPVPAKAFPKPAHTNSPKMCDRRRAAAGWAVTRNKVTLTAILSRASALRVHRRGISRPARLGGAAEEEKGSGAGRA